MMSDALIRTIRELVERDDPTALEKADQLVALFPLEALAWSTRAYALSNIDRTEDAIADLTTAISIDPAQPHFYFQRGRCEAKLGSTHRSIADFTEALQISENLKDDYYIDTLRFFRGDQLIRLGQYEAALRDLEPLPVGFALWTDRLVSREELLAQAYGSGPTTAPVVGA